MGVARQLSRHQCLVCETGQEGRTTLRLAEERHLSSAGASLAKAARCLLRLAESARRRTKAARRRSSTTAKEAAARRGRGGGRAKGRGRSGRTAKAAERGC